MDLASLVSFEYLQPREGVKTALRDALKRSGGPRVDELDCILAERVKMGVGEGGLLRRNGDLTNRIVEALEACCKLPEIVHIYGLMEVFLNAVFSLLDRRKRTPGPPAGFEQTPEHQPGPVYLTRRSIRRRAFGPA